MPIVIEIAGSSTAMRGSATGLSGSARVSPMVTSAMPATATRSPATALSAGTRVSASVRSSSVILTRVTVPSARHQATCWPRRIEPARMRHSAMRPRKLVASRLVTCACSGASGSSAGGGHGVEQDVEQRLQVRRVGQRAVGGALAGRAAGAAGGVDDRAGRAAGRCGRSSRSSSSASSRSSSRLSSTTSPIRASARSVLFTTSTTGRPAVSVLRSTKRVCGSGPSEASTSRTTPSTIDRPRSTSPPKSAWPGVSTTLIGGAVPVDRGVLGEDRDPLLALQVAGVHDPVDRLGALAEGTGGAQHGVDERGLAVVDVGDDGDVAQVTTPPGTERVGRGGLEGGCDAHSLTVAIPRT